MQLQIAGRSDQAESIYREILGAEPRHAAANHCLGMLEVQRQHPSQALPHLLTALEENPQLPDYWLGYLEALLLAGRGAEAHEVLALGTQHGLNGAAVADYRNRLAGKLADATPAPPAAAAKPRPPPMPTPPHRLAPTPIPVSAPAPRSGPTRAERRRDEQLCRRQESALLKLVEQHRFADALRMAREVSERFPSSGQAWKILGALLWAEGSTQQSLAAMQTAVRLRPQDAELHANFGAVLTKAERLGDAEAMLRHALRLDDQVPEPHLHLGNLLQLRGRYAEAQRSVRTAIALRADDRSDDKLMYSSLLFMLSHDPAFDPDALFAEHCKVGALFESQLRTPPRRLHANDADPDRRLRIGLVSGDLCNHAVAYFIESLISRLGSDPKFELHAYYTNVVEDHVSARMRAYFTNWQQAAPLSDDALEEKILDDGIDVLLDLSGHTSLNRLRTFARKPAPIQISWIGYPGTTGLRTMDYYLADRHFLPPGEFDRQFTEKLVYLPTGAPFRPYERAPPIAPSPGVRNGYITFGSFNRPGKINAATVGLWSQLLRAVPASRMTIVGAARDDRNHRLLEWIGENGIDPGRFNFHPRREMDEYLTLHHGVDLCLDTLPYSGGTTTYHAFWMGVPTLTIAGLTPASRQGSAIMSQLGLEGFIASSAADFTDKGAYWAAHLEELAAIRAALRERWQRAPIRDPDAVSAALSAALRRMWTRWCAGLPPESFEISDSAS